MFKFRRKNMTGCTHFTHKEIRGFEEDWKSIRPNVIQAEIRDKDLKIDHRVRQAIESRDHDFYKSKLNEDVFWSLAWHKINDSRLLTPDDAPRTVQDVAKRVIKKYDFEQLSQDLGLSSCMHNPEWFSDCCKIDSCFDYNKFGIIWLVKANCDEKYEAPPSTKYYIYDGCHRSLVLGKRLLKEKIKYEPIEVVLINPRPK